MARLHQPQGPLGHGTLQGQQTEQLFGGRIGKLETAGIFRSCSRLSITLTPNQFLKFQAFAEQLTKETQELKVKIETHKRENRRLTTLIDQHKDDAARLTVRLSGTEKQRDDALEALVLQQEIAEELERERKKNKRDLAALQHTNRNIIRQREEAQRVVVHLRSLISGQTHHMEHIVRSLHIAPELADYADGTIDEAQDSGDDHRSVTSERSVARASQRLSSRRSLAALRRVSGRHERSYSPAGSIDGEKVTPEMESRFFGSPAGNKSKRLSESSMIDAADRHLRDKTDAIAHIIRSISDQCAAAVEGLQLAHNAEQELELESNLGTDNHPSGQEGSEAGESSSEVGYGDNRLNPGDGKNSSIPPTPDLYRSSTAMSINSTSTANDRGSQQYQLPSPGLRTKIVEGDDESERGSEIGAHDNSVMQKAPAETAERPVTARQVN